MPNPKIGPNRGNAGKGRPKGAKNKSTVKVKEAFEAAFEELGGVTALVTWGRSELSEFYKLYAKLLPVQVIGDEENPLRTITTIELVAPAHVDSEG